MAGAANSVVEAERAAWRRRWHENKDRWNDARRRKWRTDSEWREKERQRDADRHDGASLERVGEWRVHNPERAAEAHRAKRLRHYRRRYIREYPDQARLLQRVRGRAVLLAAGVEETLRDTVREAIVAGVYSGALPMTVTREHVEAVLRASIASETEGA